MHILCFATQGSGSRDEDRIRALLAPLEPAVFPFRREAKLRSSMLLLAHVWRKRPDVVVMEGTGIAGGIALLALRVALGTRYVVSSGDAVAPYVAGRAPSAAAVSPRFTSGFCAAGRPGSSAGRRTS